MERLREILALQAGVVSRKQAMAHGLAKHDLERLQRRCQLVQVHPGVYVDHTGELTWLQRAWAAVLVAWPAALAHHSVLRACEGPGRRIQYDETIHIAVDRHRHLRAPAGVRIHRLERFDERVLWNLGPPRLRYEDAALEVAASARTDFEALSVLARVVQSRRTTAARILATAENRPRLGRRTWIEQVLRDVAAGACSVLEHGYLTRVERAHGLATGRRQRPRASPKGTVYRDVEYASGLLVELDGRLFHDSTTQRDTDFDRDLVAAVDGHSTIRLSWGQVFDRACWTASQLGVLLQREGWAGPLERCGPVCSASLDRG